MLDDEMAGFTDLESKAVAFHEKACSSSVSIWRDGLNMALRGFDPIHGRSIQNEEEPVLIVLLMRAWQTIYRSFDNALKGYYPQSLNLLRAPIEDWMAYWYVRSFPGEHQRFIDRSLGTPSFNDMLQKLESKHFNAQPDPRIRAWIKRLHSYSHVDSAGVAMALLPGQNNVRILIGPDQDEYAFNYCASEGAFLLLVLLDALNNLLQVVGLSVSPEFTEYQSRYDQYTRDIQTNEPP